ncbi:MAG: helix-turn-helix domain-containing protein [Sterolibacterium sp.]|nr:helix-turn-helix domain-containing protein [Sterolibacterium sp.]
MLTVLKYVHNIADMSALKPTKKPAKKDWNKADIKASLEKAGLTLRKLAKAHNKAHSYFSDTLVRPNPRAQKILAEEIGHSPSKIWPSRYETDGQPKRGLYTGSRKNGRDYLTRSLGGAHTVCNGNVKGGA